MELEFHQIDLRYESLRRQDPRRERLLRASLGAVGQLQPVVVVAQSSGPYILVDGYKRVRALKHLKRDTVSTVIWDMDEREALLLERQMRTKPADGPLDQAWLLRELQARFLMTLEEMAHRFDKTPSWVSRRLALVQVLPEEVQEWVHAGRLAAHTAMKVLVPLARANGLDCLVFSKALLKGDFSTREAEALHAGWSNGDATIRARIIEAPGLFLRAQLAAQASEPTEPASFLGWLEDLRVLDAAARRATRRIQEGTLHHVSPAQTQEAALALRQALADCHALFQATEKELSDAHPEAKKRHPAA